MSKKYVYKSNYDTKMEIEFCIIITYMLVD